MAPSLNQSEQVAPEVDPDSPLWINVLAADLTLNQASAYLTDRDGWFKATQLPIMHEFGYTPDEYWVLTVEDHARMVAFLQLEQRMEEG